MLRIKKFYRIGNIRLKLISPLFVEHGLNVLGPGIYGTPWSNNINLKIMKIMRVDANHYMFLFKEREISLATKRYIQDRV